MIIFRVAAAVALVLEIAERCSMHPPGVPYGGSSLAQLGVILGLAFVLTEAQVGAVCSWRALRSGICMLIREARAFWRDLVASLKGKDKE